MYGKPTERETQMDLSADELAFAKGWYGYGRWQAPYWFVGIEPGGDDLDVLVPLWIDQGRDELSDIIAHHEQHKVDWFSDDARRPQKTWEKLIWLLLAYNGRDATPPAVLQYQKDKLGRREGDVALIELSALPAIDNRVKRPRMLYRCERVSHIAARLREHRPDFVVFYSPDNGKERRYVDAWSAIAGAPLTRDVPVRIGQTTCVVTRHPNGQWQKEYWVSLGKTLRNMMRFCRSTYAVEI